jgi:hypothetical protein
MASALFVVAAIEGALGAIIVGIARSKQKERHLAALVPERGCSRL